MARPCVGPSGSVRKMSWSSLPCSSSMRSFWSLVDILGEVIAHPTECQCEPQARYIPGGPHPGSYPETGFWEVPPGFTPENVLKRGSGQPASCGHQNCLKAGVHSRTGLPGSERALVRLALSLTTPTVSRDFILHFSSYEHTSTMARGSRLCGCLVSLVSP
jgi:hypothetical protein